MLQLDYKDLITFSNHQFGRYSAILEIMLEFFGTGWNKFAKQKRRMAR